MKKTKEQLDDLIIKNIIWYCNHLKNTKIVYDQYEISDYIKKNIITRNQDFILLEPKQLDIYDYYSMEH